MENKIYDIAVLGAGCASFQLLYQMSLQAGWHTKQIALLSDFVPQQRSWCFWSKEAQPLQHLVRKSWQKMTFIGNKFSKTENILPYQYHYIPGEIFFDYFQEIFLPQNKNITHFSSKIEGIKKIGKTFSVTDAEKSYQAQTVFSSLPTMHTSIPAKIKLKQHFLGWFIKTEKSVFDETTVTIMDFSISQCNDTRFVYILPFTGREALIEMTVFSPDLYDNTVYENVLINYMKTHFLNIQFTTERTEKGAIPMTDTLHSRVGTNEEILIGTSAGAVKASTGYAFVRIGQDGEQLAEDFFHKKKLRSIATKGRFRFYERLLLGIINDEPLKGSLIFEKLFKKTPMIKIFKFLDEDTDLREEMVIFSKLPFKPFLKQIYKQWLR